jgi:hypothetical protein
VKPLLLVVSLGIVLYLLRRNERVVVDRDGMDGWNEAAWRW